MFALRKTMSPKPVQKERALIVKKSNAAPVGGTVTDDGDCITGPLHRKKVGNDQDTVRIKQPIRNSCGEEAIH